MSQPITAGDVRPAFTPQTAYIHPRITGDKIRYFEWMGAAVYTADQRAGAMHGKQFLLDAAFAGINRSFVFGRVDFAETVPEMEFDVVVNLESWANDEARARHTLRLDGHVQDRQLTEWKVDGMAESSPSASTGDEDSAKAALQRSFEFRLPLSWLLATRGPGPSDEPTRPGGSGVTPAAPASRLRLRFSLWQNRLPVDALPVDGWIELRLVSEEELGGGM